MVFIRLAALIIALQSLVFADAELQLVQVNADIFSANKCTGWCYKSSKTWKEKCSMKRCFGCSECETLPHRADCRCRAGDACWSEVPWDEADVNIKDLSPFDWDCADPESKMNLQPIFMSAQPNGFEYCGGMGDEDTAGWTAANSTPAKYIDLRSAHDAGRALRFASKHKLSVVVKSTGHEWFGRNWQQGSLMLWTHKMKEISLLNSMTPDGCTETFPHVLALQAGVQFMDVYDKMKEVNRIFSGGTCSSVGHVGFSLGGGYGPLSRMYGSGATNLVQAKVALPSGEVVTTSSCNEHKDLHWALKGGGSGFGGLVVEAWYLTFPTPRFGKVAGSPGNWMVPPLQATKMFLSWYADMLRLDKAKHFGGVLVFQKGANPWLGLAYHDLTLEECNELTQSLNVQAGCKETTIHERYSGKSCESYDGTEDAAWCTSTPGQYVTHSMMRYVMPSDMDNSSKISTLAQTWLDAGNDCVSGTDDWTLRLNYVLGGAPNEVKQREKTTSVHPEVSDAVLAFAMMGSVKYQAMHDGLQIDNAMSQCHAKIRQTLNSLLVGVGQYVNEGDRSEPNWQTSYWGSNYEKLVEVKKKYDPENMFQCHQCIGSEDFHKCYKS